MAKRIPWDEQEAAILIAACAAVNDNKKTKEDVIKEVSEVLRKRALDKGIDIDDVFRNENGISMQYMLIQELLIQEKCNLHKPSELFIKMVDLYKNNRKAFNEILEKSGEKDRTSEITKKNFLRWLAKYYSPAQMPEAYAVYYDIDKCLQKEGIISDTLFDITNLERITKIKKLFIANGYFHPAHKTEMDKYVKAIEYYYTWLMEVQDFDTEEKYMSKRKKQFTEWLADRDLDRQESLKYDGDSSDKQGKLSLILKEKFESGFRMDSIIDKKRFKMYYSERFASDLPISDEELISELRNVGIIREKRIFSKQDKGQENLLNEIYADVMKVFENGASAVSIEAVYQRYQIKLTEIGHIYDPEILGNALLDISEEKLRKKQNFLYLQNRKIDLKMDVLEMFKQSPTPLNYDDIKNVCGLFRLIR